MRKELVRDSRSLGAPAQPIGGRFHGPSGVAEYQVVRAAKGVEEVIGDQIEGYPTGSVAFAFRMIRIGELRRFDVAANLEAQFGRIRVRFQNIDLRGAGWPEPDGSLQLITNCGG